MSAAEERTSGHPEGTEFVDTAPTSVTSGSVQLEFESSTKVATLYDDNVLAGENAWVRLDSYGVARRSGDDNANWTAADASALTINLPEYLQISPSQAHRDNFAPTGGVGP